MRGLTESCIAMVVRKPTSLLLRCTFLDFAILVRIDSEEGDGIRSTQSVFQFCKNFGVDVGAGIQRHRIVLPDPQNFMLVSFGFYPLFRRG